MATFLADDAIARTCGAVVPEPMELGTRAIELVEDAQELLLLVTAAATVLGYVASKSLPGSMARSHRLAGAFRGLQPAYPLAQGSHPGLIEGPGRQRRHVAAADALHDRAVVGGPGLDDRADRGPVGAGRLEVVEVVEAQRQVERSLGVVAARLLPRPGPRMSRQM